MGYYETHRDAIDYFREEYDFLSNFYPTKVVFDGITYYNSEAAYQAQKCLHPEDRLLFALLSSDEAKRFGQKVERRPDWDDVKCGIMEQIVYAKFTQNPTLAQALLDTGEKPLKEGNHWKDLYWGVDLKSGEGENHLGMILMALRDDFRKNGIPVTAFSHNSLTGPFSGMWIDDRDITLSECECVVNATDEKLLGSRGVDSAIYRAAGSKLREECATLGGCRVGEAKLTDGYRLKAKFIIHTVGPKYPSENCRENLAKCYTATLDLAKKYGIRSIVFPSISTGKFSYPRKEACKIAVKSVYTWIKKNGDYDMKVVFSCVDPKIYELIYTELNSG